MVLKLNLQAQMQEEMIVVLPENLFQGLSPEQLHARSQFQKALLAKESLSNDEASDSQSQDSNNEEKPIS